MRARAACPQCSRRLGVLGVRSLALRIDWAAAELMRCLTELAARDPQFTIEPESVLGPIGDVVAKLTTSDADNRIRLGNAAAVTFDVNGSAAPVGDGAPSPSTVVFTT